MTENSSRKTKRCSTCNKEKPLSEFYKGKHYRDGYRGQCKACMDANVKKYKETGKYFRWSKKCYENDKPQRIKLMKDFNDDRRLKVLKHYGGNPPKCACCGETILEFLALDHIYDNGAEYRRKYEIRGRISGWIIKNNFPPIFQVLCWNCNWGKRINNGVCPHQRLPEKEVVKTSKMKRRMRILTHYSGSPPKCACCGETILEFLTIDHIQDDGAEHRRRLNLYGPKVQSWIVRNDFPDGFQVLCWNCNWGKHVNGLCPHQNPSKIENGRKSK